MKILMCEPKHYDVLYEINPWMSLERPAISSKAQEQWQNLYQTILSVGDTVTVELIEPVKGLPDMVFTANAGLIYQNQVYVSNFSLPERQRESAYFKGWFEQTGFNVANRGNEALAKFEGAGDALFLGDTLIAGYGFRSQKEIYKQDFFQQFPVVTCELIDPYFYHLDTCFCPLSSERAIYYPSAFSRDAQEKLSGLCKLIEVTDEEARQFACNAIVINNSVILPSCCPKLTNTLEELGYTIYSCDMSEFIKAGGACKCLTLMI